MICLFYRSNYCLAMLWTAFVLASIASPRIEILTVHYFVSSKKDVGNCYIIIYQFYIVIIVVKHVVVPYIKYQYKYTLYR